MPRLLLTILLALAPSFLFAQKSAAVVRQEANKCAKALLNADYESVIAYTHKRVVESLGGKEAMMATLKRGLEEMRSQGVSFESASVGDPETPREVGSWLVTLVPQTILMKVPGGKLAQESHLLGISEDHGNKWVFIDVGPLTKEQFSQLLPELAGKIDLPVRKKPIFTKDQ